MTVTADSPCRPPLCPPPHGLIVSVQAPEGSPLRDPQVIAAMAGQTFKAPSGITSKMDDKNHHLHKSVFIGEVQGDGQFKVVWKTPVPVVADPWSDYIAENKGKKNEPVVAAKK